MKNSVFNTAKLKKISNIVLVVILILGILSSAFGIGVVALGNDKKNEEAVSTAETVTDEAQTEATYEDPTDNYSDLNNEVDLKSDVNVLSEKQSKKINSAIKSVDKRDSSYYDKNSFVITLKGEQEELLESISDDSIVYLQGDQSTPFGGDRIFKVNYFSSYDGLTYIEAEEPYFEDVFENFEICASDALSEENFVKAHYANGVTSHFGDVDEELKGVSKSGDLADDKVMPLVATQDIDSQVQNTASEASFEGGDLIVSINYEFDDNKKEDEDEEDPIDTSFAINGSFGIKDLKAYLVCDMPRVAHFEELFFGLSGETFLDVKVTGEISAEAKMEASKLDTYLASFEGLNEKLLPIAIMEFKGTTPVMISHAAFEGSKDSIIPKIFVMIYSDWEGNITVDFNCGFEYTNAFNGGLRVFKKGEPCLSFEKYPYTNAYSEDDDGLKWYVDSGLEADTDLTLLGGSVLFYVAGVNIGEISVARIGTEAKCSLRVKADSDNPMPHIETDETNFYIRSYLKLIEVKLKLKAEGKSFLDGFSMDLDFEFGLLDLTMFESGYRPDKFKPKNPISTMEVPEKFESVMTLVCDVSGSMYDRIDSGQTKLDAVKEAAKVLSSTIEQWGQNYGGNYGIGVVKFSDSATTVAIPHIDYRFINDCIDSIEDGGGTRIYTGIDNGVLQLESVDAKSKVIVLMTDGQDSNDSASLESAKKAADAGIKIFTVGFGDSVDEEILKQIAEVSNGEYKYASTDNMVGIMGSFMYAQQASNATVLAESEGAVSEGETVEVDGFVVGDKSGDVMISNVWPGSFLDTIVEDPNGRIVDENYPDSVTDESKIPSTIIIKNPIKGKWKMRVKGVETSYEKEPFYTIVSFKEAESSQINDEMNGLEKAAGYLLPIGVFVSILSVVLLVCINKKRRED